MMRAILGVSACFLIALTGPSDAQVTVTGRSPVDEFSAVQAAGSQVIPNTNQFVQLQDLALQLNARRDRPMLITVSAECSVTTTGVDAAVIVEVRVDGVPAPGYGSVIFCSNKSRYYETHSFQWIASAPRHRPVVTVWARTLDADAGTVATLGDRVLTVMR